MTEIAADFPISLNAKPLAEAAEWIDEYRRFWTGKLAALEEFVKQKHQTTGKRKKR